MTLTVGTDLWIGDYGVPGLNWGLLADLWRGLGRGVRGFWKWWAREVDRLLGVVCEGCRIGGFAYPHTCGGKRMYAVWKREDGRTVVYGQVVEGRDGK